MISPHILAVVQSDLQLIGSLRRILPDNGFPSLTIARNSQEAILYLRGVGIYQNRVRYPVPSAIILDSQNPEGVDLDVLAWLRERSAFMATPVIFLCAESHSATHVVCALDPDSYLVDRANFDELIYTLRTLLGAQSFSLNGMGNSFRPRL
jgi:DNA-binding response OmpR family regulator